jgi:hypothetical protein
MEHLPLENGYELTFESRNYKSPRRAGKGDTLRDPVNSPLGGLSLDGRSVGTGCACASGMREGRGMREGNRAKGEGMTGGTGASRMVGGSVRGRGRSGMGGRRRGKR